ncbi:hypothetical protein GGTG_03539 [Gaeumannomyces tritici R3-111a-1]|uniref:Uncharacterized protein n=1 Tax=Gaeumannomyces tritici (strain R3-111a-1) TaxID=644352 RepID=J3NQI2_GAET3|nr:hypothetical protein GGTG_03539 [Gaeumannomyces tritici R3-111a-1]EJT78438.1 hypothetical protein GGTG_03539 [Gaeumannomyces tritici R3-111a-1]
MMTKLDLCDLHQTFGIAVPIMAARSRPVLDAMPLPAHWRLAGNKRSKVLPWLGSTPR